MRTLMRHKGQKVVSALGLAICTEAQTVQQTHPHRPLLAEWMLLSLSLSLSLSLFFPPPPPSLPLSLDQESDGLICPWLGRPARQALVHDVGHISVLGGKSAQLSLTRHPTSTRHVTWATDQH